MSLINRPLLPFDFAVYDESSQLSVLIEAKNSADLSRAEARAWRGFRSERLPLTSKVEVMFVSREKIYGWHANTDVSADPDWEVDATALLAPYFKRLKRSPDQVSPRSFRIIAFTWLRDLARKGSASTEAELNVLRGGEVVEQEAA